MTPKRLGGPSEHMEWLLEMAALGAKVPPDLPRIVSAEARQADQRRREQFRALGFRLPEDEADPQSRAIRHRIYEGARWINAALRYVATEAARPVGERRDFVLPPFPRVVRVDDEGHLQHVLPAGSESFSDMAGLLEDELFVQRIDTTRIKICATCGRLFWAQQRRSKCCSPACNNISKQRTYLEKRAAALKFCRQDKPIDDIARELETQPEVVSRWIKTFPRNVRAPYEKRLQKGRH